MTTNKDSTYQCSVVGCTGTTAYLTRLEKDHDIALCHIGKDDESSHYESFRGAVSKKAWIEEHCTQPMYAPKSIPREDFWQLADSYPLWVCVNNDCTAPRWDVEETYCASCYEPLVHYEVAVDKARCKAL